ncbi:hypothetical protein Anas_11918 [Armadillidium nasatum]|uniref:Uncharacterized protein n=1 Tax=Armadillidium nasatum TaxID=96803 RepID=A0A5N5SUB0_9CRUS|nr:hypothetical protein Anas_11918 [Armadillidium nasatum]
MIRMSIIVCSCGFTRNFHPAVDSSARITFQCLTSFQCSDQNPFCIRFQHQDQFQCCIQSRVSPYIQAIDHR